MTEQDTVEIMGLIYHEWSEAAETLQRVKRETVEDAADKTDWEYFHRDRLEAAIATESKWNDMKDRFLEENRETIMKGYGL